jgi:hypothetical protein
MTIQANAIQNSHRSSRHAGFLAATAIAVLGLASCSTLRSKPPAKVQLSGQWKLNKELSEVQFASTPHGPQASSHHGGMGRHGGGGYGRHGGGNGSDGMPSESGGSNGSSSTREAGSSKQAFARANEISIEQGTKELKLSADGAASVLVYGKKVTTTFGHGDAERIDGWEDSAFVVQYETEHGQKVIQKYEILDDENQLIVTTSTEGRRKTEFQTVYDRVTAK